MESIRHDDRIAPQMFLLLLYTTTKGLGTLWWLYGWWGEKLSFWVQSLQNGLPSRLQEVIKYYVSNEQTVGDRVNCVFHKVTWYLEKFIGWVPSNCSLRTLLSHNFLSFLVCSMLQGKWWNTGLWQSLFWDICGGAWLWSSFSSALGDQMSFCIRQMNRTVGLKTAVLITDVPWKVCILHYWNIEKCTVGCLGLVVDVALCPGLEDKSLAWAERLDGPPVHIWPVLLSHVRQLISSPFFCVLYPHMNWWLIWEFSVIFESCAFLITFQSVC